MSIVGITTTPRVNVVFRDCIKELYKCNWSGEEVTLFIIC